MSNIYEQLARMPTAFPIKPSSVTVNATSTQDIVSAASNRIYVAFTFTPTAAGDLLIPDNQLAVDIGYLLPAAYQMLEFWIEKHKGMVINKWRFKNTTASAIAINIIEMFYGDPNG